MTVRLETDRIVLRPPRPADLDGYAAFWGEPDALGPFAPGPFSREESWARLLRFVGHWACFRYGLFLVEDKRNGRIVGEIGLAQFRRGIAPAFDAVPEAAWRIAKDCRGNGYASEAMRLAIDWAERSIGLDRAVCMIHPDNHGSRRVAAKLGFREYGEARYRDQPMLLFERLRSA